MSFVCTSTRSISVSAAWSPLLEAAPHAAEADLPHPPEPPSSPEPTRSAEWQHAQLADNLVHRGGSLPDPPTPALDPLDEIKEKRRISLTSNFLDSPPVLHTSTARSAPPSPPAGIRHPAPSMIPSRTRARLLHGATAFAAARELPGNPADADPLYTAPDEEPVTASAPPVFSPEPSPAATEYAVLEGNPPAAWQHSTTPRSPPRLLRRSRIPPAYASPHDEQPRRETPASEPPSPTRIALDSDRFTPLFGTAPRSPDLRSSR